MPATSVDCGCTPIEEPIQSYIPFFREDARGQNKPGAVLVLSNRNVAPTRVQIDVYDCEGNDLLAAGPIFKVVPPDGNDGIPDPFPSRPRLRLRDYLADPDTQHLGNIVVSTLDSVDPLHPLTTRVEARLLQLGNGDDVNALGGYELSSQWEASGELWEDYFLDVRNGSSANFNVREFIVVTNPTGSNAEFHVDFFQPAGDPAIARYPAGTDTVVIPPHGCGIVNTAHLIYLDPFGVFVNGNAIVTMDPNEDDEVIDAFGVSVIYGPSGGGPVDTDPLDRPTKGNPEGGTDLRTESRR